MTQKGIVTLHNLVQSSAVHLSARLSVFDLQLFQPHLLYSVEVRGFRRFVFMMGPLSLVMEILKTF